MLAAHEGGRTAPAAPPWRESHPGEDARRRSCRQRKDTGQMASTEAREHEIVVNGRTVVTGAATLAAVIEEQGFGAVKVATALNGDFVPARARASTHVGAGDRIEILTARQGG